MIAAVLTGVGVYLGLGLVIAGAFVVWGVGRVDPAARGAGVPFRLIILPGAATFWPFLLWKWLSAPAPAEEGGAS